MSAFQRERIATAADEGSALRAKGSFSGRTTWTLASTTPSIMEIVRAMSCASASMKRILSSDGDDIIPVFLNTSPIPCRGSRGRPCLSRRLTACANFASEQRTFHVPSSPGVLRHVMPASSSAAMTRFAWRSPRPECSVASLSHPANSIAAKATATIGARQAAIDIRLSFILYPLDFLTS